MTVEYDILIVGGGHGGAQAAIALRQAKFLGSIAVISNEREYPYERPPLSKDYLAGEKSFERIMIRPQAFWAEREVTFLLGEEVTEVSPEACQVVTEGGTTIGFGDLIWAAGGKPRRLTCSGADFAGVHTVRNRADVDRLIGELPATSRVVVIGGGYIGLETAAVLTKLGKSVTLLEALPRVLARVAGEPLSAFYEAEHRARGVDLRTGATVDCIVGENGRAAGVRLANGSVFDCQMVIVGIGIAPAVEPLLAADASGGNGVDVDSLCRTSLRNVYAIGDCAAHANRFADGATIRVESVQNANDMAVTVARTLTGAPGAYDAVPWFWSNQYDLRLQTVGLSTGHDTALLRGDPATRSFSVIYLKQGRVIALDCVNAVKDYVQGRTLVLNRARPNPLNLSDAARPLKDLPAD